MWLRGSDCYDTMVASVQIVCTRAYGCSEVVVSVKVSRQAVLS